MGEENGDIRAKILASESGRAATFVREWDNAQVFVRSLSCDERAAFDRETLRRRRKEPDRVRVMERLVVLCAEDQHGARLFKPGDEDALAGKAAAGVSRLFRIAARHNGFLDDDEDDAGNS